MAGLTSEDLPGFWRDSDAASKRGQNWVLKYSGARLGGSVVAAVGGVLSASAGQVDLAALMILVGFVITIVAELALWQHKPEQIWYDGRALAESSKTLAWRYSVAADPFPADMPEAEARTLLRTRLREVSGETTTQIVFDAANAVTTPGMEALRREAYEVRRAAYVQNRTLDQQRWYAKNAKSNGRRASGSRVALIVAELAALVTAALRVFGGWDVDLAGLMGAFIAAGAAWVALKQFAPLAAAYSLAAKELALQADRLVAIPEAEWSQVAADAEEAISREHTLWLASRTGKAPLN